jgi:23S rRNA (guanosine2251-2'-O)-methyltransferase
VIVYGRNAVREALRGRRRVQRVFASERAAQEVWLGNTETNIEETWQLEERCGSPDHQGICAEVGPYPYVEADSLLEPEDALVLALDEVQDPHNLGAAARVAEAAGCAGIVLPERRSAEVTPAVCRASAGAVEHLAVARVRNLADFLREAKEAGAWVYGADGGAERRYATVDWGGKAVIVLGSEGQGLRPRVRDACDDLVRIPLHGRVESLNVAATAAILLFEAVRSRAAGAAGS